MKKGPRGRKSRKGPAATATGMVVQQSAVVAQRVRPVPSRDRGVVTVTSSHHTLILAAAGNLRPTRYMYTYYHRRTYSSTLKSVLVLEDLSSHTCPLLCTALRRIDLQGLGSALVILISSSRSSDPDREITERGVAVMSVTADYHRACSAFLMKQALSHRGHSKIHDEMYRVLSHEPQPLR